MSSIKFVFIIIAAISSCKASGFGHIVPAVKSFPIVRYAPFYSFPHGVRSIHAVAPALPPPVLPAPAPPLLFNQAVAPIPAPILPPAPILTRALPAPVFARPALPFAPFVRPVVHGFPAAAPVWPAPVPFAHHVAPGLPPPALAPAFPAPVYGPSAPAIALGKAFPFHIPPHANPYHFYGPATFGGPVAKQW